MFGIGSTELLIIFIVALVVLGPKSIPSLAKTIGKAMGDFRRVSTEFQRTMNVEAEMDEHEQRKKDAEEELFGSKKDDKAIKNKASSKDNKKESKQTAQAETDDAQDVKQQETSSLDTENSIATKNSEENQVITIDTTISEDSPVAQAVKKAEAEANAYAETEAQVQNVAKEEREKSKDIA